MRAFLARVSLAVLLLPACAVAQTPATTASESTPPAAEAATPAATDSTAPAAAPQPMPRVTAAFTGADLLEALHRVFLGTGFRYEAKNVSGPFALNVSDIALEKALRLLLSSHGLLFQREGDLYRITPQEGYQPTSERLEAQRQEHLRRYWQELSQRPAKPRERSRVRFAYRPVPDTIDGSSSFSEQRLFQPGTLLPTSQNSYRGRTLDLGPLQIPLPDSVRFLPGGGMELSFPSEGEYSVGGMSYPYMSPNGVTLRLK